MFGPITASPERDTGGVRRGYGIQQKVSKAEEDFFFSEEKKEKTFMSLSRSSPAARAT
jgi:hypothetical protein